MENSKTVNYSADCTSGEVNIYTLQTGRNWLNVLWNERGYQTVVTHTGASTSVRVTESGEQIKLNAELSTLLYLRNSATGEYAALGGYPCGRQPDNYCCTHAQLYSQLSGSLLGAQYSVTVTVHPSLLCELRKVTLRNQTDGELQLDLFACTVFDLGGYPMPFYYNAPTTSATEYCGECNAVLCLSQNPYGSMKSKSGFIAASETPNYYCGNLGDFTGVCGSLGAPDALQQGRHLSCTDATVRERCGITEHAVTLKSGESKTIYYALGFVQDKAGARQLIKQAFAAAPELFGGLKQLSSRQNIELQTNSPYKQINTVLNFWASKQVRYCCIGKKAVRDNAQLAAALLNFASQEAKASLAECLRHQYSDGHAMLLWYPVTETRVYSDPAFWLVSAIAEYIKETDDLQFLNERMPYFDGGEETVCEHIERAAEWYSRPDNYGGNGLFKIYTADWNDALNIPDENAESVFASECACYLFGQLYGLYKYTGENAKADEMLKRKRALAKSINLNAFNGKYYVRAISKFGRVGDRGCGGGEIYCNTQSWAILADIVPPERLNGVLAAVDGCETDMGVPMCVPPYPRYDSRVGRMSGMLPGVYENGAIYNHAGCFKVMADCVLGRGEHALKTLLKILPDSRLHPSSDSELEPYVFSNCYLTHPAVRGKVASSWQTGTSAWGLRCYYEGILGLRRTYGGLLVKPCLPNGCGEITAVRRYRGGTLNVTYRDCGCDADVYLNGEKLCGNLIPSKLIEKGGSYTVTAVKKGEPL